MVGINRWILQTKLGLIFPNTVRPDAIPAGVKWISINLFEQTLTAYEGDRMVFVTLVASGLPGFWTRPGTFQTQKKYEIQTMSGSFEQDKADYYYVGDVPWVMYFDRARAIHGEYWHNNLGAKHSHGCVNVPVADAHWLFNWAPSGTWVNVYDPSGKTPTDDKYYLNDAGI
jgi:lipoprotein-anchoring transpeptidase ErfK/SrfK